VPQTQSDRGCDQENRAFCKDSSTDHTYEVSIQEATSCRQRRCCGLLRQQSVILLSFGRKKVRSSTAFRVIFICFCIIRSGTVHQTTAGLV
jgi:hypothetical protein